MIVYNRLIKKEDFQNLEQDDEELIYYKDNNIAFVIVRMQDNNYAVRKKKIFNNELVNERFVKTVEQIIKIVE